MKDEINKLFGIDLDSSGRAESYDYIESFIEKHVADWTKPPKTEEIVDLFFKELKQIPDNELAFLICHTGFIPEFYGHDSSQETLYSKLVEAVVCEWAIRLGFKKSFLQTQKASKEDVTIVDYNDHTIVCDAKSFRLGRSQGAPNVKDVIKKADYDKWLESYAEDNRKGGLLTFPSLHNWKKGSDVYLYCSDKSEPIMLLFYEHMSFALLKNIESNHLLTIFDNYDSVHPTETKEASEYLSRLEPQLFDKMIKEWEDYKKVFNFIIAERVQHTIQRISRELETIKERITIEITTEEDLEKLKSALIDSLYHNESSQLQKNLKNIKKFRSH
ncbi:HindIII family type II restriction endonuclease [Flagellimonas flava]|uniref:HindIII restriction endonuclease n=1 Tax=Flagellimonas flava TaxID=570519 RepID=A0A1M5IEC2_9FLAO|nr:HindIII family type II restriction endonuclease [Allomuricauda flava]SHG26419.1 HindIII restriction endonuclease [Allomuricauda flava]